MRKSRLGSTSNRRKPAQQQTEGLAQADGDERQTRAWKAATGFDFDKADPRRILTLWLQWRLANGLTGRTQTKRRKQSHGSALEFEATAVMVGKFVVTGKCGMIVSPQGTVEIRLTG